MNHWPHHSQLTLIALPNAPYWARRFAGGVLVEWGAQGLLSDAELVITELVTNAVEITGTLDRATHAVYAKTPRAVSYTELAGLGTIRLRLSYGAGRLLTEVWDKSDEPPKEQLPDFESESGRGLFVVKAYSEKWGWYPADRGGKVVWAELHQP